MPILGVAPLWDIYIIDLYKITKVVIQIIMYMLVHCETKVLICI